jgi:hypothetical protein
MPLSIVVVLVATDVAELVDVAVRVVYERLVAVVVEVTVALEVVEAV